MLALAGLLITLLGPGASRAGGGPADVPEPNAQTNELPAPLQTWTVGAFSTSGGQLPDGWKPLEFENIPIHTDYSLEQQDGRWVVRADADGSASGLILPLDVDLAQWPVLRWSWKVSRVLERGDVSRKSGDDYAARIYVAFRYEPERVGFLRRAQYLAGRTLFGDIPIGAINYIWASRAERGAVYDNPYAGSFVKMIPIESGADRVGAWVHEERNVYDDYVRAFGEAPPRVEGIALMSDTDNTGESVTAWYGDISLVSANGEAPGGEAPGPERSPRIDGEPATPSSGR